MFEIVQNCWKYEDSENLIFALKTALLFKINDLKHKKEIIK